MKVDGEIKTVPIEKNGPVAFVVTTTRTKLNPENETRMLSLELSDTAKQTARAMKMIARVRGLNEAVDDVDFAPWRDFQRWLAAGETRVYIPFATELADLIPPKAVRVRRDFAQVLAAIKAHALLHREHRERDRGEIVATIKHDYRVVRGLMRDILAEAVEVKVRPAIIETVEAVERAQPEPGRGDGGTQGATLRAVAAELRLDQQAVRRRLHKAMDLGLIANLETRPRQLARYVVMGRAAKAVEMLPRPEVLQEAHDAAVAAEKAEAEKSRPVRQPVR